MARITAVADVFDVLVHERPYKDSWSVEAAVAEIRKGAGTQFDPDGRPGLRGPRTRAGGSR